MVVLSSNLQVLRSNFIYFVYLSTKYMSKCSSVDG